MGSTAMAPANSGTAMTPMNSSTAPASPSTAH
jgi:hypothetical protein